MVVKGLKNHDGTERGKRAVMLLKGLKEHDGTEGVKGTGWY